MELVTHELFSFRRCPYAMRARMALYAADVSFIVTEVSLKNKPAKLLNLSPKGTVPVLVTTDGQVIDQSLDIMRWSLAQADPLGWLERSGQPAAVRLLKSNDGDFKYWLDRYKYPSRYPDEAIVGDQAREHAMDVLLKPLGQLLAVQPFLGGAAPALEDVAIFPFVRQFAGVETSWFRIQTPQAVQRWLACWLATPLFERVMQKQPELPRH